MINLLETYTVIIIEKDGSIIYVTDIPDFIDVEGYIYIPRDKYLGTSSCLDHCMFFPCLEKFIPDLLENMVGKEDANCGLPFAECIAANGRTIIWPINFMNPSTAFITMPDIPTEEQCLSIKEILPGLSKLEYMYANTVSFNATDSSKIDSYGFSESGNYEEVSKEVMDYIDMIRNNQLKQ